MLSLTETPTVTTKRLETLEHALLQKLSLSLVCWAQEMRRSGKSLEERRQTVEDLKNSLSATFLDCQIYLMTLKDRGNELEELSFLTGHPFQSQLHTHVLDTHYRERNPES